MHTGELYYPNEESIFDEQLKKLDLLYEFNSTRPTEQKKRQELMKEMFAEIGKNCYLEPPFHANWGGAHMHLGDSVYANFNFTAVDDSHIYIGSYTMIGPNVTVATAGHPILPELREKAYQFNMPVHIGAGSVVTKDIPANVVAYGNPCRVAREISEHDREFYYKDRRISQKIFDEVKKM